MQQLRSTQELDDAVSGDFAFVYKHSFECPISAAAKQQVERFLERHPDAPLFMVDVNASADLSEYLVEKSGIEHGSPQMIVFQSGEAGWSASHGAITADSLEEQLRGLGA